MLRSRPILGHEFREMSAGLRTIKTKMNAIFDQPPLLLVSQNILAKKDFHFFKESQNRCKFHMIVILSVRKLQLLR